MKKVFYLYGRAFALLILMQLSSCTDRNLEMKPEVATVSVPNGLMPTVSEGRLVFNSNQQFKAYMEMIAQKPIEEVIQMNKSIGFHSFFEKENDDAARKSGEGTEQEEEVNSIIPDSDFALVLNNNLEMELEHQKIYRLESLTNVTEDLAASIPRWNNRIVSISTPSRHLTTVETTEPMLTAIIFGTDKSLF